VSSSLQGMEDIWSDSNVEPSRKKKLLWLYSFLLFIFINVCSLQGWLGATNAEVSKRFETVLTPTGYVSCAAADNSAVHLLILKFGRDTLAK